MIYAFHQTVRLRYHHHYHHHRRFVNNGEVVSSKLVSSLTHALRASSVSPVSNSTLTTTPTRTTTKLFMSTDQNQHEKQMIQRTVGVGSHVSEMEVKKSRFVGYTKHVENWDQAQTYIEQVKLEHPKARHWCFGFRCGTNPIQERCSDDGEPTGTGKYRSRNDNFCDYCGIVWLFDTDTVIEWSVLYAFLSFLSVPSHDP